MSAASVQDMVRTAEIPNAHSAGDVHCAGLRLLFVFS